ncbi:hypothetical protein LSAT2_024268 [Lamellibrachia satsuma]|nr:hypothetical protein LSAT2_024268 [Lamellibrachia satsuma]
MDRVFIYGTRRSETRRFRPITTVASRRNNRAEARSVCKQTGVDRANLLQLIVPIIRQVAFQQLSRFIHWDVQSDNSVKRFADLLEPVNIIQHVQIPTHIDGHTIDLILTPKTTPGLLGARVITAAASTTCIAERDTSPAMPRAAAGLARSPPSRYDSAVTTATIAIASPSQRKQPQECRESAVKRGSL